jgi:serine/threonine protein kinase
LNLNVTNSGGHAGTSPGVASGADAKIAGARAIMSHSGPIDIDCKSPPFDQFRGIHRLAPARSGHASTEHAGHQLYIARDRRSRANVLIKVTSKPGIVYEQDLTNEIASLTTINRELPDSRYFPVLGEHGRLRDSRVYLTMSYFDERPLATTIGVERIPARQVAHLRTAIEVATALIELHGLKIWHVDLNPMNILCRWERGRPVVRIVDFESSFEEARHSRGVFYNPPTTSAYSAPELSRRVPDARSDLFSLGAVLYTMLAGYEWTWATEIGRSINADHDVAAELKGILLTATDPDPARRYRSSLELRVALAVYLEHIWPGRSWQRC